MFIKSEHYVVYKLLKDGRVIYVGKSCNIISRLYQHQTDKNKDFDDVDIIDCLKVDLDEMEFAYICKYSPKLNKDLPVIRYSVRDTAAAAYNKCISNNTVHEQGFDLKSPDFKVKLGGKQYGLWAKKGDEESFFSQIDHITRIIKEIE